MSEAPTYLLTDPMRRDVPAWNEWVAENRFAQIDLSYVDLRNTYLDGVECANVKMVFADMRRSDMPDACFRYADLSYADLRCANLWCADFGAVSLFGADLRGARIIDGYLSGADLRGANLWYADLSGANVSEVVWDTSTVWPEGFTPPEAQS